MFSFSLGAWWQVLSQQPRNRHGCSKRSTCYICFVATPRPWPANYITLNNSCEERKYTKARSGTHSPPVRRSACPAGRHGRGEAGRRGGAAWPLPTLCWGRHVFLPQPTQHLELNVLGPSRAPTSANISLRRKHNYALACHVNDLSVNIRTTEPCRRPPHKHTSHTHTHTNWWPPRHHHHLTRQQTGG